jgi:hypothetical protein
MKLLRGREGRCCLGWTTFLGCKLIGFYCAAQLAAFIWLYSWGKSNGLKDLTKFFWFSIESLRIFFWLLNCKDSIQSRKIFFLMMLLTTIAEAVFFATEQYYINED